MDTEEIWQKFRGGWDYIWQHKDEIGDDYWNEITIADFERSIRNAIEEARELGYSQGVDGGPSVIDRHGTIDA